MQFHIFHFFFFNPVNQKTTMRFIYLVSANLSDKSLPVCGGAADQAMANTGEQILFAKLFFEYMKVTTNA